LAVDQQLDKGFAGFYCCPHNTDGKAIRRYAPARKHPHGQPFFSPEISVLRDAMTTSVFSKKAASRCSFSLQLTHYEIHHYLT
jgi:hypothetical protein